MWRFLLDVRAEADFLAGHAPGAVGIPLEELTPRVHELPARGEPFCVGDVDLGRLEKAANLLRERGHNLSTQLLDPATLTETGPARGRLWRASAFLLEAITLIESLRGKRALDLACGTGRDAVWLALQGYDVTAIDNLPDALDRARDLAQRSGVTIRTVVQDLRKEPSLGKAKYDLINVSRFLLRPLLPAIAEAVAPGGYIVYDTFHEKNLTTGLPPTNPAHLLKSGELREAFAGFEVLIEHDPIERGGRWFGSLLARKR